MPADRKITILLAEDDPDDRFLLQTAFVESGIFGQLRFVNDGEELMNYLVQKGEYANGIHCPQPNIVLLDLNMPKKDGREALREIKQVPSLRNLTIIILTTSGLKQDMDYCRRLGVANYFVKPSSYSGLLKVMEALKQLSQGDFPPASEVSPRFPPLEGSSTH